MKNDIFRKKEFSQNAATSHITNVSAMQHYLVCRKKDKPVEPISDLNDEKQVRTGN